MKVLTYNVKMLPGLFGKGVSDLERAELIAAALRARDDDIVALQEVFDESVRALLVKLLGGTFPHRIERSGNDWLNEDSGLMLLSRRPFVGRTSFAEWTCKGPLCTSDRWADKGVQLATVEVSANVNLLMGNLHLQADYAPRSYATVRTGQLKQLAQEVARALDRATGRVAALVVGDFNVMAGTSEYAQLLQTLSGARDLWSTKYPDDPGYTVDRDQNTMTSLDDPKKRIDLALAFDAVPQDADRALAHISVSHAEVVRFKVDGYSLSDHDAVAVTFDILTDP